MRLLLVALFAGLVAADAWAADEGLVLQLNERMAGRELRIAEDDAVVGIMREVTAPAEGDPRVLVDLEGAGKTVALGLEDIRAEGGKYYVDASPDQLAGLPAEPVVPDEPAAAPPYGGLTPGWGTSPGPAAPQR